VKTASCGLSDVPRRKLRPRRGHEADKKSRLHAHIGGSISEITFDRPCFVIFVNSDYIHVSAIAVATSGYKHSHSRFGVIDKGK
jgi:hypothetical protein